MAFDWNLLQSECLKPRETERVQSPLLLTMWFLIAGEHHPGQEPLVERQHGSAFCVHSFRARLHFTGR